MICLKCKATIEDDSVYCPECGASQRENSFCSNCGVVLEEGAVFCPECGIKQAADGVWEKRREPVRDCYEEVPPAQYRQKSHGGKTAIIVLIVVIALAAVAGLLFWFFSKKEKAETNHAVQQELPETESQVEETEEVKSEEVKPEDADIVAVGGEMCSLEGIVKTDGSGKKLLGWDESVSVYGMDEVGKAVFAESVTNIYINDIGIDKGVLDIIATNKKVVVSGQIYFIGDSIYIKANKITDDSGNVLENNKDENSTQVQKEIVYEYIIPYSDVIELSSGDVAGLSLQEINYAKNEIYARHGRMFESEELRRYFNSKNWYQGTISAGAFDDTVLSTTEKKNVNYLKDVEFSISPDGYLLDTW